MANRESNVVGIPLIRRDGTVIAHALVDDGDATSVSKWAWHLTPGGYAVRSGGTGVTISMHRWILGLKPGNPLQGDHRNRNKLDNRRSNLRIVTSAQQSQNISAVEGKASRYRGVSRAKDKWRAAITIQGKTRSLGVFVLEERAALEALWARRKHYPYSVEDGEA